MDKDTPAPMPRISFTFEPPVVGTLPDGTTEEDKAEIHRLFMAIRDFAEDAFRASALPGKWYLLISSQ